MRKIFIICMGLFLGSCSNFLEEYSQDLSKIESYTDLDEVLLGDGYLPVGRIWNDNSYFEMENNFFQTTHYMSDELSQLSTDDYGDGLYIAEDMFGWYTWQQEVGLSAEGNTRQAEDYDWNEAYHCINTCNSVLLLIDEQDAENEEQKLEKNRIKGEAAFLRALYYFTLVNLYGEPYSEANRTAPGVPIKTSAVVEDREYVTNTVEEVYEQILSDLDLADTCLVNAAIKNHPYRADITSVYLLKSRVYLYMQNWEEALRYAQKVIEKNPALLDLNSFSGGNQDVLTKSSPETIFSMGGHVLASAIYNQRGTDSWGSYSAMPAFTISDDLSSAFDEGENDLRTQYYIMQDSIGGGYVQTTFTKAWVFVKVRGWEMGYKEVSDNFLFRTAEAYLNGAEAAAYMGEDATARNLLKTLRDNRMVDSRPITEAGEALVTLIRNERQRELCLEGHRWFDLRRYMVHNQYPYTKTITHSYTTFDWDGPVETRRYVLEENDPAYTLALPREVREFQNTLGSNHRPVRSGTIYTPPVSDAYNQGYEDGYAAGLVDGGNGDYYGDAYYNDYFNDYSDSESDDYDDGFETGYEEGLANA